MYAEAEPENIICFSTELTAKLAAHYMVIELISVRGDVKPQTT